jgi:hypothetical protein
VKTYRIITTPTFADVAYRDALAVGDLVHVLRDEFTPDSDGDVKAYVVGRDADTWLYVNARHLAPVGTDEITTDRAAFIVKAREILGADAPVDSLIKLAEYLQGGQA